jgi:hypothetical protein
MRRPSTYRKVLASIVAILVLTGTTGFYTEEHRCMHYEADYRIFFFQEEAEKHLSCEADTTSSCCSDSPAENSDAAIPGAPDFLEEECCIYDYGSVNISDPVPPASNYVYLDLAIYASAPEIQFNNTGTHFYFIANIRSDRIPFRDPIIFNSQFLT